MRQNRVNHATSARDDVLVPLEPALVGKQRKRAAESVAMPAARASRDDSPQ
jgi:hypothetical protein